jgi:hypothetical protein
MTQAGFDNAMKIGTQAVEFWRQCATVHAESTGQLLDESMKITRVLLRTQSEMVDAAGKLMAVTSAPQLTSHSSHKKAA